MCLWSGLRGLSEGAHIHHRSLILTALTETEKEETESRPFWAAQPTSSSSCKHVLIKMVASVIKLNLVFMIYELWSYHINDDCEHVMMSSQTFLWRAAPTTPVWTWAAPSFHGGKLTRRSCTYSLLCSTIKTIRRIMILLTNNFLSDCAFQFFLQKKTDIFLLEYWHLCVGCVGGLVVAVGADGVFLNAINGFWNNSELLFQNSFHWFSPF